MTRGAGACSPSKGDMMADAYRLFVNDDRTVLVRIWDENPHVAEVATREDPAHVWGPPVLVREEGSA
jgi:hypothetical protein